MPFMTGAIPAPSGLAFAVDSHRKRANVPAAWGTVPKQLDVWGNDTYGDCVSAEEAWATAAYSWMLSSEASQVFIDGPTLIAWARAGRYLNGAMLTDVMDTRAKKGIQATDGKSYTDGPYQSVNWQDFGTLSSAIFTGPVKIGVDHRPLSKANAGNGNGWLVQGSGHYGSTDHCVGLGGFGTIADCYRFLGMNPPSQAKLTSQAVLLFTWGTIGVVDMDSLDGMTSEAWLRTPTNPEITPPPQPPPTPTPGPLPPIPIGGGIFLDPNTRTYSFPPDWTPIPTLN